MTWAQTPQGALRALRDVIRDSIAAQLVLKNTDITNEGLGYQLPTTVPDDNIRMRQQVFRPIPQNIPAIKIVYESRIIDDNTTGGFASTSPEYTLHFWFTTNGFDDSNQLDSEEVLILSAMDFGDVILKTVQAFGTGVMGTADGSVTNPQEASQVYFESYFDENFSTYTIEGRLRVRLIQDAEYA